jgi:hypothetical protein
MSLNDKCIRIDPKELNNKQKAPKKQEVESFLALLRDKDPSITNIPIKWVHLKYYHTVTNLNLSWNQHVSNIAWLMNQSTGSSDMEKLFKLLLDQTNNLLKLSLNNTQERLTFARFCLQSELLEFAVNHRIFTVEQYASIVLCSLFESITCEKTTSMIQGILSSIVHDTVVLQTSEAHDALREIIDNEQLVKCMAQLDNIFRDDIMPTKESYRDVYLSFVQRLFYKRINNAIVPFSLMDAYQATFIIAVFFTIQPYAQICHHMISLLLAKSQSFYADIQTVDLVINLCSDQLDINDWRFLIQQAQPLAVRQFFRYVKFANERLLSKGKVKKLLINKKYLDEATIIKVNDYVTSWFNKENEILTNNLVKVVTAAQLTPSLLKDWNEIDTDYKRMNDELHLPTLEGMNLEDYKLLFDPKRLHIMKTNNAQSEIDEEKLQAFAQEQEPDDPQAQRSIQEQMKHLIFQYNRCINPPLSIQALSELRQKESVCKRTNVGKSLFQRDELKDIDQKERDVLEASKYASSKFESQLKFSNYYCGSCNNAYKQICGEKLQKLVFGWEDDVNSKYYSQQMLEASKKGNKVMATLFRNACADMRTFHLHACFVTPDESHTKEILNRMPNAKQSM